jgi:hypothetical protein
MGLGNQIDSHKIYLSVGFGKIRRKTDENGKPVTESTPKAVRRATKDGTPVWALEYPYLEGKIQKIFLKEDTGYGVSIEIVISDILETFQLSLKEESRYGQDFFKKLPNIDLTNTVKLTPYDFKDKETGKPKVGVSIEQFEKKVQSYYEVKTDGKWNILHGYPEPDGVNFLDKDELKIYFIKVKKFLRTEFLSKFGKFEQKEQPTEDAPEIWQKGNEIIHPETDHVDEPNMTIPIDDSFPNEEY